MKSMQEYLADQVTRHRTDADALVERAATLTTRAADAARSAIDARAFADELERLAATYDIAKD